MRGKILTVEERDEILRRICENLSNRSIATRLGRNQSIISREITRNGGRDNYRVYAAQNGTRRLHFDRQRGNWRRTSDCMMRSRKNYGTTSHRSRSRGRLKQDHPDDPVMRVSHETIYRALFPPRHGASCGRS